MKLQSGSGKDRVLVKLQAGRLNGQAADSLDIVLKAERTGC